MKPGTIPEATTTEARDTTVVGHRPSRCGWWRVHAILFVAALAARLAFQGGLVGWSTPPKDDAALYDSIAASLSQGGAYVDAEGYRSRRAPAFTFLLAGLYATVGHSWPAARVTQAVLGAAACSILLSLGSAWLGRRVGLAAALACAIFPYTVYWSGHLLSEPLCTLLTTASTWALLRAGSDLRLTATWAFLCALATLTRPNMGLLFVLGMAWILPLSRRRWAAVALALAVFCLALSPWAVRNYLVHHAFVPITSMGGVVLWEGNNPIVAATPYLRGRSLTADLEKNDPAFDLPELEQDRVLGRRALRFIRERAGDMPGLVGSKSLRLWNVFPALETSWQRWLAAATLIPVLAMFGLGVVGACARQDVRVFPLLVPVFTVMLTAAIYWADARIRAPADPMILLVASYGLWSVLDPRRGGEGRSSKPGTPLL
ncbi:MAG: hypothetical protein DMF52_15555 [Acidobacteria bacterium]|nr:MAG: hypothetical protein DMF52_15555 [Acidobacteriota bacterium]